ncbi:L-threonine 3-dehydrogenase [Methylocaldum sp. RMAD-M]|uniref:L-threonine 3-dehydrogenase n=1 Tax=Methylocaldum sp. RMAD-M TaxID=2806557 RepID=UPI000A3227B0|nr:L-threonine 3-dehydrogenase [Methylocaldum sp. RMAD-M]MBP1150649.1 nucleoside-diphosphate-sugar epimerase [Methylocaldum sp. RMAD-M]
MGTQGRILVTGALGQIGSELIPALRTRYGDGLVVAADIRMPPAGAGESDSLFEHLDCTQLRQIQDVVRHYRIETIYHLAALLSAVAEDRPQVAWNVNMGGLYRMLEVARQYRCAVFFPSSIGAFGPTTPREDTPQDTIQRPTTIYGITKLTGELLCDYYFRRFGVDTRGLRLPGIISYRTPPGGGTTDYAVEIFYQAIRYRHYTCFLRADTRLDMMYMPDAVRAMMMLMEADAAGLKHRNAFNVTAMSFTPGELAAEIRKHIPEFAIDYEVDPVRQAIADSWPQSLDDSAARTEWGWTPHYDITRMTNDMLEKIRAKLQGVSA